MKVVVAPDSFKGSLTSSEATKSIKKGILHVFPDADVVEKPMADGGEGTLEALLNGKEGETITITCSGPLGEKQQASYGIIDKHKAIIEMARIAGLPQVPEDKRNPDRTTTFGIGEAMIDALDRGCTEIIIGLGGSATNDGGLGMLQALGMDAWNEAREKVGPFGKDVHQVNKVDLSQIDPRINQVKVKVACDVDNPLCGNNGATAVYGPQKGITEKQIRMYDQSLDKFSEIVEGELGTSFKKLPGAGAAGGLGFALLALGAELISGAKLVSEAMDMEQEIKKADFVITGEGKSDEQTLYGKAPGHIASIAKKYEVPAILISGSLSGELDVLNERFAGCFSIVPSPLTLKECMDQAGDLLYQQTKQILHFIQSIK